MRKRLTEPHVVIVGGGFGGLAAANTLAGHEVKVTLIDRRNYHLFQPLLYQVATAGLSPAQIASPIRNILKSAKNCRVLLDAVTHIYIDKQKVVSEQHGETSYDYLIVATGSQTNFFQHEQWAQFTTGLKSVEEATGIRKKILLAFEKAEMVSQVHQQQELLNFVIIGGGPTGVEMAGAIAELSRLTLAEDFRNIKPSMANIYLIEAGDRVLPTFSNDLSQKTQEKLTEMGVKVMLDSSVTNITEEGVYVKESFIPSQMIVWAAGVKATPVGKWLNAKVDQTGRIEVNSYLQACEKNNLFVLGDVAAYFDKKSQQYLPGVAPVAMQQGRYVGRFILEQLKKNPRIKPFSYSDKGMLTTVGRSFAVTEIKKFKMTGFLSWLIWAVVHIFYLIGFKNRFFVFVDWIWSYFTFQRGARLILEKEVKNEKTKK